MRVAQKVIQLPQKRRKERRKKTKYSEYRYTEVCSQLPLFWGKFKKQKQFFGQIQLQY